LALGNTANPPPNFHERAFRVSPKETSPVQDEERPIKPDPAADVLAAPGGITDPAVADRVIGRGVERFGRVDTLVNNAGVFLAKPFTEYTGADFAGVLSVNLAGFCHVTRRAVRQMLTQGGGHIVSLTTTLVGQPVKGVPSALASLTKGGLDAVTRSLAIEYADKGIRVNAVAPGVINTPMHPPATHAALAGLHPLGRMGEVREVVEAVLSLESAALGTGETLHVDGGAHAGRWRPAVPGAGHTMDRVLPRSGVQQKGRPSETSGRTRPDPASAAGRRATDHPGPDGGRPGQRAGGGCGQRRRTGLASRCPARP
jgi:NAD(P)-dependent dehydrogenase (short-subunit alcohol dehydrogenase family)